MTREEALEGFKKLYDEIDKENHLFVGTINPDFIAVAIHSLKAWDEVRYECWDAGHNFAGEYQGVWVRFRDIERIIEKHLNEVEE